MLYPAIPTMQLDSAMFLFRNTGFKINIPTSWAVKLVDVVSTMIR